MQRFIDIVETVTSLSLEEMEEVQDIISKVLLEKRRSAFLKNHQKALQDAEAGTLFSSDSPNEITGWLKEL